MSTESPASSRLTNATPAVRRAVRETALRILYTVDTGKWSAEEAILDSTSVEELSEAGRELLRTLVAGTLQNRDAIDATLDRFATDFPTQRQAVVDRNILRIAVAEIVFHATDAPAGAVVNEAVELAKKYSTKDSGRFVNGVLGALVRDQGKTLEPIADDIEDDEPTTEEETEETNA